MPVKKTATVSGLSLLACLLCLSLFFPTFARSADIEANKNASVTSNGSAFPVVTLKSWSESSQDSRYSFLFGFITALEMEKQWQGDKPLPLEKSLNHSWVEGLKGATLTEIYSNVNAYIEKNPSDLERPLVEYLWYAYAQPKVVEKVGKEKNKRIHKLQSGRTPPVLDN